MSDQKSLRFTNDDGRIFSIRLLRKNEYYGDGDALCYELEEPSVEFFDASGFDTQTEILGYFTGIRCAISEIFTERAQRTVAFGEHLSVWNISEQNIFDVQCWLQLNLMPLEKAFIKTASMPLKENVTKSPRKTNTHRAYQDILEDRVIVEPNLPTLPCVDEIDIVPTIPTSFLRQQLEAALRTLDIAETSEDDHSAQGLQVRLHILDAKRHILKALASLSKA
jgi:hypothetical protein